MNGTAESYVALFLFLRKHVLFSIVVIPIYIPINSVGGFSFLHTLIRIYYLQTF